MQSQGSLERKAEEIRVREWSADATLLGLNMEKGATSKDSGQLLMLVKANKQILP